MAIWTPADWRDASAYAPVLAGGRPALAWELLRRDPAYRVFLAAGVGGGTADGLVAAQWGLHFRS